MGRLRDQLPGLLEGRLPERLLREGAVHALTVTVTPLKMVQLVPLLASKHSVLVDLFCVEGFEAHSGLTLIYVFEFPGFLDVLALVVPLEGARADSIAEPFPAANWYQREIADGFGVEFEDAFDRRRLLLHEAYPPGFHPLRKSFRNQRIETREVVPPGEEYPFRPVRGEGVYEIPVGPVHAGIIEPGHFRFSVVGETIFNLEIRLFYKHRGVEKLAEGKPPAEVVPIAESVSGDETVANSVAFCSAVEAVAGVRAPPRAWHLRTAFLEMERIYSHLGDLAGMVVDVAYPVGASPFFALREEVLRQNRALTGSRFMKGAVAVGGLKGDPPESALSGASEFFRGFPRRFERAVRGALSPTTVIDRFETTGVVHRDLVVPLNLTGPVARASGAGVDTRVDHPYGIYGELPVRTRTRTGGDVLARFEVKVAEILDSVRLIEEVLRRLPAGDLSAPCRPTDGFALSLVEAPRGQNVHWVSMEKGLVERYRVRTPSFCNWQAMEHAVLGNIVPDFPLINKSMNLSYAGTDR